MACVSMHAVAQLAAALLILCLATAAASGVAADRSLLGDEKMMGKGGQGKMKMMGGKTMMMKKKSMCPMKLQKYKMPYTFSPSPFKKTMASDLTSTLSVMPNGANQNMAPALATANLAQIIFTLFNRTQFAPHYHPHASELWTVIEGTLTAFTLVNGKLTIYKNLMPGQSVLFPVNTLHGFFNPDFKSPGVASAVFNNAMPGAMFYEDLSCAPQLLKGFPTLGEIEYLIKFTMPLATPNKIPPSPFFKINI